MLKEEINGFCMALAASVIVKTFLSSAKGEEFAEKYSFLFKEHEERGCRQLRNSVWCRICYALQHYFSIYS